MRRSRVKISNEATGTDGFASAFNDTDVVQSTSRASIVKLQTAGTTSAGFETLAEVEFGSLSVGFGTVQRVMSNRLLEKRLISLSRDFYEDYGKTLDSLSISGLNNFLRVHQDILPPKTISADEDGKIEATWEDTRGQSASFRFLDKDKFHYALVVETPGGRQRPWGTSNRFEVFVARPEARTILGESSEAEISVT